MIIGIDPDTKASGVAFYYNEGGYLAGLYLMTLYNLLSTIEKSKADMVCISAGWLNKVVNFQNRDVGMKVRERISERIGANHEIGKQIAAFCKDKAIPYTLVRPRGKKLNSAQFSKLTGWVPRTNQETRDAGMAIYSYLNSNNKNL